MQINAMFNNDIAWLQVTMNNSSMMWSGNAFGNVQKYTSSEVRVDSSKGLELIFKIVAINEFFNKKKPTILLNVV